LCEFEANMQADSDEEEWEELIKLARAAIAKAHG
jgi:hypothetical protein